MKIGISLKIDVTKIDKQKLFKGEKGTYLDAVAFVDLDQVDQYGNSGMITQDAGKEVQGAILGNSKIFWRENQKQSRRAQQSPMAENPQNHAQQQAQNYQTQDDFVDEIPF